MRKIGVKMEGRGFACGKRRFARQGASGVLQLALLYISDLGIDRVVAYRYSAKNGSLEKMEDAGFRSRPGAGPRHLAFDANGRFAYLVNELDNSVLSLKFLDGSGILEEVSGISSLPANFAGENTAAEIQVGPDGRNLHVSNRGHDSMAVFKLFPDGTIGLVGHKIGGIRKPRHFVFSPDGRMCLVSNEDGGDITFRRTPGLDFFPECCIMWVFFLVESQSGGVTVSIGNAQLRLHAEDDRWPRKTPVENSNCERRNRTRRLSSATSPP